MSKKQFIRYSVLPGIRPRLQELIASGFSYIPFFIALVYQSVNLLPATHPYVNSQNIGKFGLRHVIAEAANNLVIDKKNIDQVILFFTILFGLAIVFIQFSLLGFSLFVQPVMAAAMPTNFAGFFLTPAATQPHDLALIMLDLVFGVPDIFGSCVSTNGDCHLDVDVTAAGGDGMDDPWRHNGIEWPFPVHVALQQMFQMYSIGLLVVATLITLYFMVTIVIETAQTGTAFGKRFNKVWAPLRIVVAFGLLVPLGYGLNSSQYIVLYAAKFGSGFATNGWNLFNKDLTESYLGDLKTLVTRPTTPEVNTLLQFMFTASICYELELRKGNEEVEPFLVKDPWAPVNALNLNGGTITDVDGNTTDYGFVSYEQMMDFADNDSSVTLRFGRRDEANNPQDKGYVDPVCGEIIIPIVDSRIPGTDPGPEPAADLMQRYYWFVIDEMWYGVFYGSPPAPGYDISDYTDNYALNVVCESAPFVKGTVSCPGGNPGMPPNDWRDALRNFYKKDLKAMMDNPGATGLDAIVGSTDGIVQATIKSDKWIKNEATLQQKGWGGAAIWYNKVAELNGTVGAAVRAIPKVNKYPFVMEYVLQEKQQQDQNIDSATRFEPVLAGNKALHYTKEYEAVFAPTMYAGFSYFQAEGGVTSSHTQYTGNKMVDLLNSLFGTEGLYSMRRNPDAHPLAQLVGVGRSLINASIGNLADSTALALAAKTIFGGGDGASAVVGILMTIVMISLTAGFILFYVVPFLPFIYFFFAVGGWIKGIFEAMVGAPLWALAHIRIDGNGLAGQAAVNGYFLIFEIFLRPILIVFGLLASIAIFSALVTVMNQTWDLVTANLAGFDARAESEGIGSELINFMRGPVDEFFFTVVYTIIVYLMAMSSFKLIDLIPNNILRWMGQSVATFNDQREDPAQGLTGTATIGAQQTLSQVGGGAKGALQSIAQ